MVIAVVVAAGEAAGPASDGDAGADWLSFTGVHPVRDSHAGFALPVTTARNPARHSTGLASSKHGGARRLQNGIIYHGGSVLVGPVNVYPIFYGNAWTTPKKAILTNFLAGVSSSPWLNIITTYNDASGTPLVPSIVVKTAVTGTYTSASLSDANVVTLVTAAAGATPDANGLYVVFADDGVTTTGYCSSFCGYHRQTTISGTTVSYLFVGNPLYSGACTTACRAQAVGPNGDAGVDSMVNILATQLVNTVTNPGGSGWYDSASGTGYESGTKCAWNFGSKYPSAVAGASANIRLGAYEYLIQENWVNANGGFCSLSWPVAQLKAGTTPASTASSACSRPKPAPTPNVQQWALHQAGILLRKCITLNDCSGHGLCNPTTRSCSCFEGWGATTDLSPFGVADCSQRTCCLVWGTCHFAVTIPQ